MAYQPAKIPADELEDFRSGVVAAGLDPGGFKLSARDDVPLNPGPIARIVAVERGGVLAEFSGGNGEDWLTPALAAVKSGTFGK